MLCCWCCSSRKRVSYKEDQYDEPKPHYHYNHHHTEDKEEKEEYYQRPKPYDRCVTHTEGCRFVWGWGAERRGVDWVDGYECEVCWGWGMGVYARGNSHEVKREEAS